MLRIIYGKHLKSNNRSAFRKRIDLYSSSAGHSTTQNCSIRYPLADKHMHLSKSVLQNLYGIDTSSRFRETSVNNGRSRPSVLLAQKKTFLNENGLSGENVSRKLFALNEVNNKNQKQSINRVLKLFTSESLTILPIKFSMGCIIKERCGQRLFRNWILNRRNDFNQKFPSSFSHQNCSFCTKATDEEKCKDEDEIKVHASMKDRKGVLGSSKNLMEGWYTVPNAITLGRMASSPFISYLILTDQYEYAIYGLVIASCSDFLDGYIAKNWNQQSLVGTFLDPLADKILISFLAIPLAIQGYISVPLVGLMFTRDALLVAGSFLLRASTKSRHSSFFETNPHSTFHITPSVLSKSNTVFQFILLTAALTNAAWSFPPSIFLDILSGVVAFTTFGSGMEYLVGGGAKLKKKQP